MKSMFQCDQSVEWNRSNNFSQCFLSKEKLCCIIVSCFKILQQQQLDMQQDCVVCCGGLICAVWYESTAGTMQNLKLY